MIQFDLRIFFKRVAQPPPNFLFLGWKKTSGPMKGKNLKWIMRNPWVWKIKDVEFVFGFSDFLSLKKFRPEILEKRKGGMEV